ncbi:MAG: PadR family transcriptional regulator [Mycobacteriales bacterium]|nr:PadR family transcriptional regulator [Frankia sp.]
MSPTFAHGALRLYLLKLLDEQPRHGYELMQQIEDRLQGLYAPSAGTIYPRLARLEADGLVEPVAGESGRKTYRLTDAGRAELAARKTELADVENEVVGSARSLAREIRADVRASVRDLRTELKNAVREVRREERRSARPATSDGVRAELDAFARDLATRLGPLADDELGELRRALHRASGEIARSLRRRR